MLLFQRLRCWNIQYIAANHPGAVLLVVLAENRPANTFDIVRQEKPAAVPPGEVHRRVTPVLGGLGRGGGAGLQVGIAHFGQTVGGQPRLAALVHPVQGGQVFVVFDGVFGAPQNLFHRVVSQGFVPQFFYLLYLAVVLIGGEILVVVVQPKQGEYLVDGIDVGLAGADFSLPRRCR